MTIQAIKDDAKTLGFNGSTSDIEALCYMVFAQPQKVYEFMNFYGIGTDSVIREKIFTWVANKFYDGDYEKIYNLWLT
jgi:hypothetical protein